MMKKKKILRNQNAFTIIELLVAISLFTVITTIVLENYISFINDYNFQHKKDEMQFNALRGVTYLEKQLRLGRNFVVVSPTDITFDDQAGQPNEIRTAGNQLSHFVNGNLRRIIFSNEIFSNVTFTWNDPEMLIDLFFVDRAKNRTLNYNMDLTVFQRTRNVTS